MCMAGKGGEGGEKERKSKGKGRSRSKEAPVFSYGVDMKRMRTVIQSRRRRVLNSIEEEPQDIVADASILHFLYGKHSAPAPSSSPQSSASLQSLFADCDRLRSLESEEEGFWVSLLTSSLLPPAPMVCVIASPSEKEAERLSAEEKERVSERRREMGEEGGKEKEGALERAMAANNVPVPAHLLDAFPIPDPSKIPLIQIVRISQDGIAGSSRDSHLEGSDSDNAKELASLLRSFPLHVHFDVIQSNFVEFRVLIDTGVVTPSLRPLLELYLDLVFRLPIERVMPDGKKIVVTHDQACQEIEDATVSYSSSMGIGGDTEFSTGQFGQLMEIFLKVEPERVKDAVRRINETLFHLKWDTHYARVSLKKLIKVSQTQIRDGDRVVSAMIRHVNYTAESNHYVVHPYKQNALLKAMVASLDDEASVAKLKGEFESLLGVLANQNAIHIQITGKRFGGLSLSSQACYFLLLYLTSLRFYYSSDEIFRFQTARHSPIWIQSHRNSPPVQDSIAPVWIHSLDREISDLRAACVEVCVTSTH